MPTYYASLACALVLGAIHALAFAPAPLPAWALPLLQILAFVGLSALAWRSRTVKRAALTGAMFGMGHFGVGISWIFTSLHVYGHMVAPLAAGGVLALAIYLSIYPALAAGLSRWFAGQWLDAETGKPRVDASRYAPVACALGMAAAWTATEWLRGVLFTGFPWLNVGYAHVDGPLHGWAPLVGVYGVAFMASLVGAGIAAAGLFSRRSPTSADGYRAGPVLALSAAALVLVLGSAAALLNWVRPHGAPISVRLVQANIPLDDKFDPAFIWQGMDAHRDLAEQATPDGKPMDLILMPETAVPVFQDQLVPEAWQEWVDSAREARSTFVLGVALRDVKPDREYYYNGVVTLDANTTTEDLIAGRPGHRYSKSHLVPFGEYVPPGFKWFVNAMIMPLGDFDRGVPRQKPFPIAGQHVAMNICYEDVFGEELLPAIRPHGDEPGATVLANVSNLAWFGDSLALPQHLQMSRMRVRETGRPMLRATNTGMTAIIDAGAQVQAELPPLTVGILDGKVQGTTGLTPYTRTGNVPTLVLTAGLLALFSWRRRQARV